MKRISPHGSFASTRKHLGSLVRSFYLLLGLLVLAIPAARSQKVSNLTAAGQNIQWFLSPTGGVPLDPATDLVNNQKYYASQSVNGVESPIRLEVTAIIITVEPPVEGTHVPAQTQIEWHWNTVPGATGYKWNTVNDFGTAFDVGAATQYAETGLACNSNFTRFVWEYSGTCHSDPVVLTGSTTACWTCGISTVTVGHNTTGGVAPVNKSVTYGTVTNIAGESGKCWITSNLGADRQALSADDGTEASSGWYWQFNRRQGFRHDGIFLTPAWTTSSISENSDWLPVNDPCTLELGSPWRLPTYTEWNNVDNSGSWTDWTGPWNSALKLHMAGYLFYVNGTVYNRGSYGFYWSSTQEGDTGGWDLMFHNTGCTPFNNGKSSGFSVRCIRE